MLSVLGSIFLPKNGKAPHQMSNSSEHDDFGTPRVLACLYFCSSHSNMQRLSCCTLRFQETQLINVVFSFWIDQGSQIVKHRKKHHESIHVRNTTRSVKLARNQLNTVACVSFSRLFWPVLFCSVFIAGTSSCRTPLYNSKIGSSWRGRT